MILTGLGITAALFAFNLFVGFLVSPGRAVEAAFAVTGFIVIFLVAAGLLAYALLFVSDVIYRTM